MTEVESLLVAAVLGLILGGLYFYGLWFTVRHLAQLSRPGLWLLASWIVRVGLLMAGVYLIAGGDWRRLVAALAGILLARILLTRRLRNVPASAAPGHSGEGGGA